MTGLRFQTITGRPLSTLTRENQFHPTPLANSPDTGIAMPSKHSKNQKMGLWIKVSMKAHFSKNPTALLGESSTILDVQ